MNSENKFYTVMQPTVNYICNSLSVTPSDWFLLDDSFYSKHETNPIRFYVDHENCVVIEAYTRNEVKRVFSGVQGAAIYKAFINASSNGTIYQNDVIAHINRLREKIKN